MFNPNQQLACEQIDYDVPQSTCGYPIYFSLCVDGHFDRPTSRPPNSTLTLPRQHSQYLNSDSTLNGANDVQRFNTLPPSLKGYDEINGDRNQNIVIPDRDFNFNQLLQLSEKPKSTNSVNSDIIYDVPRPISSTIRANQCKDNVYPAQLVITAANNSYDTLPPTPPTPSSIDRGLTINTNLRQLPRSGSHDLSRSPLPRLDTSLPLPLTTTKPISNFGSTSSLPSPISSLETSSISFSSGDGRPNNRSSLGDQSIGSETYDVPPSREAVKQVAGCCSNCGTLTLPKGSSSGFHRQTGYHDDKIYDKPPSSNSINNNQVNNNNNSGSPKMTSSRNTKHDQISSSQRPVKAMTAITRSYSITSNNNNHSLSSSSSSLSSSTNQLDNYNIDSDGLDLNLDGGLKLASRLESESLEAIGKLIGISSTEGWRNSENLENKLTQLSKLCSQLKCVIRELEVFTDGIYVNSLKSQSSINNKLYRLARQLKDSAHIVISTVRSIDKRGWKVNELSVVSDSNESRKVEHDELDQLIACMPGLKEDIKHIISLVKSYGNLLFPVEKQSDKLLTTSINKSNSCLSTSIGSVSSPTTKSTFGLVKSLPSKPGPPPVPPKPPINLRPLPLVPTDNLSSSSESTIRLRDLDVGKVTLRESGTPNSKEEVGENRNRKDEEDDEEEDEDYASLETTKDKISQRNSFNSNRLSTFNVYANERIEVNQETVSNGNSKVTMDQLLSTYCPLLQEHNQSLRSSVNALISAINSKQLPNVLVSLSKLVVIAGQQMISTGQTINREVSGEISCYIAKCCNSLCQSLKNLITHTKSAVNLYPSAPALQDLLDSIVQVSIHSDQLTLLREQIHG